MTSCKRFLAVILSLMMVLSFMAGCGGPTDSAETDPQGQTTPATTAPAEETEAPTDEVEYFPLSETGELSLWIAFPPFFGNSAEGPSDYLVYTEAQERLNVNITFEQLAIPVAAQAFNIMIASEVYPDLLYGFSNYYTNSLDDAISQDIIIDLTELIEEYAPDYNSVRLANEESERATVTASGNQALIYYAQSEDGYVPDMGPVIRKDWLDEVGLDEPVTYDDYEEIFKAFQTEIGCENPFGLPAGGMIRGLSFIAGFDLILPWQNADQGFYHIDNQVYWGGVSDACLEYLTKINSWYNAGYISPDFASDTLSASSGVVSNDRIGSGEVGVLNGRSKELEFYDGLAGGSANFIGTNDAKMYEGQITHTKKALLLVTPASGCAVSTGCEDTELAVRFLNYFFTEEGDLLANYGVENLTFDYDAAGNIYFTDLILNNPDELSLDVALALYTGASSGIAHRMDNTKYEMIYSEKQLEAGNKWVADDDGAMVVTQQYSALLDADEISEFTSIFTDIKTYFSENLLKFITGNRPLSEFEDYVAEIERMGIDRVCEMMTEGWNEYLSR